MKAEKLYGRMESVLWEPPLLTFVIERHGSTIRGSTRAELQHWTVDVNQGTATLALGGHRQLYPAQPRLNIQPLVDCRGENVTVQLADGDLNA
jgi:hypothetical protein